MFRYAFFLNSYNDIDNIIPIIWKFLTKNETVILIFSTDYNYNDDYRITYLQKEFRLKIYTFPNPHKNISFRTILRMIKYLFGNYSEFTKFLKDNDISVSIFEWKVYYSSSLQNMFFGASQKIGIPTIALPHGVGISTSLSYNNTNNNYINTNFSLDYKKIKPLSYLNEVDLFVESSPEAQSIHTSEGLNSDICEIWGSARYCLEWVNKNLEIIPKFIPSNYIDGQVKLVFMLPRWGNKIDFQKTNVLINNLIKIDWIYLVIKERTRGDGSLSSDFRDKLNLYSNVEASVLAHSASLIKWSDVVINIDSSIGIEAIVQDKILISPTYLSKDHTIFEDTGVALMPKNNNELLRMLNEIYNKCVSPISHKNKSNFMKEVVYGGNNPYDILEFYWIKIRNFQPKITHKKSRNYHFKKIYVSSLSRFKLKMSQLNELIKDNPANSPKRIFNWILKIIMN